MVVGGVVSYTLEEIVEKIKKKRPFQSTV